MMAVEAINEGDYEDYLDADLEGNPKTQTSITAWSAEETQWPRCDMNTQLKLLNVPSAQHPSAQQTIHIFCGDTMQDHP